MNLRPFLIGLLLGALAPGSTFAQSRSELIRGSDGQFDASSLLAKRGAFLPMPIIITEPAIGYGGGLAALWFHGGNPLTNRDAGQRYVPPSITGAAAFGTQNGSRGGGALHFGVWRDDHIRYIGAAAAATLNLDYWGSGANLRPEPLQYEVSGGLVLQRLQFRVGDSPFMVGGEWSWSRQNAVSRSGLLPSDAPRESHQDDSGAGVISEYETLDNLFTASHGMKVRLLGKVFSKKIGGDNDRQRLDIEGFGYIPAREQLTIGVRSALQFSDGDTPFYLRPYVSLRGLPALKYAGKHTALGELEARWQFYGRWSVVGFGGLGYVTDSKPKTSDATSVGTYGGGFRYLLAERLGIHTGIDYARGPDDYAIYLIMGSAWR